MKRNLILETDSYKLSHFKQYPPKTERVYSYLESRGGMFEETLFFGLQPIIQSLQGKVFNGFDIERADEFAVQHFGRRDCFNYTGWTHLFNKYEGTLPIRIKAVPEGTVVPVSNVLMTIENTDSDFPWLTNYLETLLLKVWYPITVATLSREIKKVIKKYHIETGSDISGLDFKLHDFGYRGVSSEETAAIGAAAHLINFKGSDTIAGIRFLQEHYGVTGMPGFSIPATEHSTITAWGRDDEYGAYKNVLEQYPEGMVACVSDSYDLEHAVQVEWGWKLRPKILERSGVLVIRPDSGNPVQVIPELLGWIESKFGATANQKGFKVLNPKVRVIQGDGVNYFSIIDILGAMKRAGWAAENVAFGMGGALLQQLNRDTQKFAIKCSSITIDGVERDVWKEPVGDPSKASKRGRLVLGHDGKSFRTVRADPGVENTSDILETVFLNGEVTKSYTLEEIRERAKI